MVLAATTAVVIIVIAPLPPKSAPSTSFYPDSRTWDECRRERKRESKAIAMSGEERAVRRGAGLVGAEWNKRRRMLHTVATTSTYQYGTSVGNGLLDNRT